MWIFFLFQFVGLWIKNIEAQSPVLDSRCFLGNGGSAESFLVSEDIALGAVIGTLNINGDAMIEKGDIDLSLRERDAPVKILPGTKDLVLITPLDKEGVRGPASVYVNVICDRRNTNDPSFVIPVNIRVTDINDNAPKWVAAPYILSLSEVTVPGTRVLQGAHAIDQDQPGPFSTIEYQVLQGPFSDYVQFVSPLEGTLVLKKSIDYETVKNFTIKLRAQDQGNPPKFSDTTLRVVVIDADDQNPKFLRDSYSAELPLNDTRQIKVKPEPIQASDQDEGIKAHLEYSIKPSPEAKYFSINPSTGLIKLTTSLPLDIQHTFTLVIKATQLDNADRYALATLTFSKKGTQQSDSPLAFLQKTYVVKVREDLGIGSRILSLLVNKVGKSLIYEVLDEEQSSFFTVSNFGELLLRKSLDFEKASKHSFSIGVSDGIVKDKTDIRIEVLDVNDWEPRFRQAHYQFVIQKTFSEMSKPISLGKLEAADGDKTGDKISIRVTGPFAFLFRVDHKGVLWFIGEKPNVTTVHFLAIATDSGLPPRSTSVPVSVSFETSNVASFKWAPGVLTTFSVVLCIFLFVIFVMSIYIHKQRNPDTHFHNQPQNTLTGATHEYLKDGIDLSRKNLTIGNPMNTYGGSSSSISAGASTILAASLEREAKKERDDYNAAYKHIISRNAIAQEVRIYDKQLDRDCFSNDKMASSTCWSVNGPEIVKNINFDYPNGLQHAKVLGSGTTLGNSENNLTVYF